MNNQQVKKYVTTLYQALLIDACKDAQHNIFNASPIIAWNSAKKLRLLILDQEKRKPLDEYIERVEKVMGQDKIPQGYTAAENALKHLTVDNNLVKASEVLYDKILKALESSRLLEIEAGTNYQNKKPAPIGVSTFDVPPT
jgi:hypothetical protein